MNKIYTQTKKKILVLMIIQLIIVSSLTPILTFAGQFNESESVVLHEDTNVGYGVITEDMPVNYFIQNDYATELRNVMPNSGIQIDSLEDQSSKLISNIDSVAYAPRYVSVPDYPEDIKLPTFIQALNKTNFAPHVNITTGLQNMGVLPLDSRIGFTVETKYIYLFSVTLDSNAVYDLNMRSTGTVNCLIYDATLELLVNSYTVIGTSRQVQPLFSQTGNPLLLYFYASNEADIIIEPIKIQAEELVPDVSISKTFINPPDQIWNETIQDWQQNKKKETVHVYHAELPAGSYHIKYAVFDNVIDSSMIVYTDEYMHTDVITGMLNTMLFENNGHEQTVAHFTKTTRVYILIVSEPGVEFDYLFSIKHVNVDLLDQGDYHYQGSMVYFLLNVSNTQVVFLNKSGTTDVKVSVQRYAPNLSNKTYYFDYNIRYTASQSKKILLIPGLYFFLYDEVDNYDFWLTVNRITPQNFENSATIQLSQNVEASSSYALLRISPSDAQIFDCYNFTFSMPNNYTIEVYRALYTQVSASPIDVDTLVLGNQQQNGEFFAYKENNTQALVLFAPQQSERYLLLSIETIYNNTDATWPNKGTEITNTTTVSFNVVHTDELPDSMKDGNYNEEELSVDVSGNAFYTHTFNENDSVEFYALRLKAPLLTWYNVSMTIVNGTIDSTLYFMPNSDGLFLGLIYGMYLWNRYYVQDVFSPDIIYAYEPSNISNVLWYNEFGTFDEDVVIIFVIEHTGLNGTISIRFDAHNSTELASLNVTSFIPPEKATNNLMLIIGGSIAGVIGLAVIVIVVLRVVKPKTR